MVKQLTGSSLDRYHILEKLGEGGMATVYKAFDTRLEREVAVKVIHPVRQHTPKFLKRFEREAKALAQLSHPNIVKVLDYGEHDGLPYIVMEYFPGGTLKEKLGKPMLWQKAAKLLAPIAQALDYAHQCNIIHRDVKPANILISDSGQAMLSDFGIAKVLELEETVDLTGTGVGIGTPEYMAPEQGLGKTVDHRADIYSLGVVFYELVTGRKPFRADTPMAVVVKQIHDPLPRPKTIIRGLPISVERVLFKALVKKPEDRFQSMAELAHTLERLGRGEKPGRGKLQTGSKRRKWLLLGMGATALFIMLLFLGQYVYEIPTIFYHNQPESTLESFNEPTKKLTPSVGAGFQGTQDAAVAVIDQTATPTGLNMMGTINAVRTQLSATASAETKTMELTATNQVATATGLNMMGTINAVRTQLSATASALTKTPSPEWVEGKILFEDDFESGNASKWFFNDQKWNVIQDDRGNYVLQGKAGDAVSTRAEFGNLEWTNYALELKIQVITIGSRSYGITFELNPRSSGDCPEYKWIFNSSGTNLGRVKEPNCSFYKLPFQNNSYQLPTNGWIEVRIEVFENVIKTYINSRNFDEIIDRSPINQGGVSMMVKRDAVVWFDDVRVIKLIQKD